MKNKTLFVVKLIALIIFVVGFLFFGFQGRHDIVLGMTAYNNCTERSPEEIKQTIENCTTNRDLTVDQCIEINQKLNCKPTRGFQHFSANTIFFIDDFSLAHKASPAIPCSEASTEAEIEVCK
ncbi:MAG: hypothetical protein WCT18_02060 [Patescibacteria group bacterium]